MGRDFRMQEEAPDRLRLDTDALEDALGAKPSRLKQD